MVKKTSTKAKGSKFENDCKKKLEKQGYTVMKSPRKFIFIGPGRFISKANDYFGLYDLCAKKDNLTRWIQCKVLNENSHGHVAGVKNDLRNFHEKHMGACESSELWVKNGRVVEVYKYDCSCKEFKKEEK